MKPKAICGKVQREMVQDVVGNRLSEQQAESVSTCFKLACGANGKEVSREEKQDYRQLRNDEDLATAGSRERAESARMRAAGEIEQVVAINSGPACRRREAPGTPERKEKQVSEPRPAASYWGQE